MSPIKEFIEHVIHSLIEQPEKMQTADVENEKATVLEVKLAKEDVGKVIGRSGRTADALRTVMGAASSRFEKKYHLQILDLE